METRRNVIPLLAHTSFNNKATAYVFPCLKGGWGLLSDGGCWWVMLTSPISLKNSINPEWTEQTIFIDLPRRHDDTVLLTERGFGEQEEGGVEKVKLWTHNVINSPFSWQRRGAREGRSHGNRKYSTCAVSQTLKDNNMGAGASKQCLKTASASL